MLQKMKEKWNTIPNNPLSVKGHYYVTGYLYAPVLVGKPAQYFYNGKAIRTSTVQQILEASEDFITFETLNSIYTISYTRFPQKATPYLHSSLSHIQELLGRV